MWKPLPEKHFTMKHETNFSLQKKFLDSWAGTGFSIEPCDPIVLHQENRYKHIISPLYKMHLYLNIKNIFCLIQLFPIQMCKILFIKVTRCFNFQMFLPYTLISTLLHFLIHNVLNCFSLSTGSFTCSAQLERGRIPSLVCLNFKYLWSNYKNKMLRKKKKCFRGWSHLLKLFLNDHDDSWKGQPSWKFCLHHNFSFI